MLCVGVCGCVLRRRNTHTKLLEEIPGEAITILWREGGEKSKNVLSHFTQSQNNKLVYHNAKDASIESDLFANIEVLHCIVCIVTRGWPGDSVTPNQGS